MRTVTPLHSAITVLAVSALLVLTAGGCRRQETASVPTAPRHEEPSAPGDSAAVRTADSVTTAHVRRPDRIVHALRGRTLHLSTEGLTLTARGESVRHGGDYSVTRLYAAELPALPQGMVNLTASAAGYRLLPSGDHFSPAAELRMAYDPDRLPQGYTPDDIYTSYYDSGAMAWVRLERLAVDTASREIVSLTTHFTDFVNEVLKAPEMPETQAFVPTMMSDLEAANPIEGVTLVQPPTANSHGTAEVSYPLVVPAGRGGMQPNLVLTYSSGGGSGWLGDGWDIPIPDITVETRWGVPRYDRDFESETYLHRGEQLTMKDSTGAFRTLPHRTRDWDRRVRHDVQFVPRVNDSFDSIVRHGTAPYNYWWEIYDRGGVVHRYGHYTSLGSMGDTSNPSTLRDDLGNIARWCLTESEDTYGNMVRYLYDTVQDAGIAGGTVKGRQIYPADIQYTVHTVADTDTGYFHVVFWREDNDLRRKHSYRFQSQNGCGQVENLEGQRIPATISGRYGFKEVTASLLSHIWVYSRDSVMRAYTFGMRCDSATDYRLRLVSLEDHAVNESHYGNPTYTRYEYSAKGIIHRGCGSGYPNVLFDYYEAPAERFGPEVSMREVWSSHTGTHFPYGNDVHSITMSYEPVGAFAGTLATTALGSTMGYGWNASGGVSAGLGFNVFWTEATVGGTFDGGRSHDEGFLTLIDIDGDGLPDKVFRDVLGRPHYRRHIPLGDGTFYYGVAHPVAGMGSFLSGTGSTTQWGIQVSLGISATGTRDKNDNYTTDYFADVNADGLPDLVTDEGVLFNDLVDGRPTFDALAEEDDTIRTSTMPCGYVVWDGELNDSLYCEYTVERYAREFPSYLSLERLQTCIESLTNRNFEDIHLEGDSLVAYHYLWDCSKRGGDTADFGGNPEAVKVWVAPRDGTITIRDSIRMLDDGTGSLQRSRYADGVRHSVQWNRGVTAAGADRLTCTDSLLLPALTGTIDAHDMDLHTSDTQITVAQGDLLLFRLQSRGNHNLDRVDWRQGITYTDAGTNDSYGRPNGVYSSSRDFVVCGNSRFQAPDDGTVTIDIEVSTGQLLQGNSASDIIVKVSFQNGSVESFIVHPHSPLHTLQVSHNNVRNIPVHRGDTVSVELSAPGGVTTWGNVLCRPKYTFTPNANSAVTSPLEYHIPPHIVMGEPWTAPVACRKLFGPLYRGWGRFTYRAEGTDPEALIPLWALRYDLGTFAASDTNTMKTIGNRLDPDDFTFDELEDAIDATHNYNPLGTGKSRWRRMEPDSRRQLWLGYGNGTALCRTVAANTILTEHFATGEAANIMSLDCPASNYSVHNSAVRTHAKETESVTWNLSGTAAGIVGTSRSWSTTRTLSDYMDLNGDRYPDLVSQGSVQYTLPHGGLENGLRMPFREFSDGGGGSVSANFSPGDADLSVRPMFGRTPRNGKTESVPTRPQTSVNGNHVDGRDTSHVNYADINGDGLPDRVHADGTVELNIGYRFLPAEPWGCGGTHRGTHSSLSVSCSMNETPAEPPFNIEKFSIGGGASMGISDNHTVFQLTDLNGDGLPDRVWCAEPFIHVYYNLGNGLWSEKKTLYDGDISHGTSFNEGVNVSVTAGGTVGFAKVTGTVGGSTASRSFSGSRAELMDVDGDGLPDYVSSSRESDMTVRFNKTGKCGLLRQVRNLESGSFTVDYTYVTPTYDHPQGQWVMSECHVSDESFTNVGFNTNPLGSGAPSGPESFTTFSYRNPRYDRYERTSLGFDTVMTVQHLKEDDSGFEPYRLVTEGYRNGSYLLRGRKRSESVSDLQGHRYEETLYDVVLVDMENGTVAGSEDCPRVAWPQVEKTIVNHYEGHDTPRQTSATSMQYDNRRNVVLYINWGDTNYTGDELRMEMHYLGGQPRNLVSLRDSVIVRNGRQAAAPLLRLSAFSHNPQGRLVQRRDYSSPTAFSPSDFTYDSYGNLHSAILPPNDAGERMHYSYSYDAVLHTYPVRVDDALGRHSSAVYSIRHGKPLSVTDVSGNMVKYKLDTLGRVVYVTAPDEVGTGAPFTWQASYLSPRTAVTRHYDLQHPNDPITTVTFCDGWGRVLQVKKDAVIAGQPKMVVSGETELDALGRAVRQYDPVEEPLGSATHINAANGATLRTETTYDILDRAVARITHHSGTTFVSTLAVGYPAIGGRTLMRTVTTDPLNHTTTSLADAHGRTLSSVDASGGSTLFGYDALGQLLQSTDPEGFITSYSYDLQGKPLWRKHPDAGMTQYAYDRAGNVTAMTNAAGETVQFTYHYNLLTDKRYPRLPQNDVHYYYDIDGHVFEIHDASGMQQLSYDRMGRVSRNIRTFAVPYAQNTYTFTMEYEYDSWNRMLSMTYPDGEVVSYAYDLGGQLKSMTGQKGPASYSYIDDVQYDRFGSRTRIDYGNGTFTCYTYDDLQRLEHLRSYALAGNVPTLMQDIHYTLDDVGNISDINNTAPAIGPLGGAYSSHYIYDDLYRLETATQFYDEDNELAMGYSASGRLCTKVQSFTRQNLFYGYDKRYAPHAPRRILNASDNILHDLQWDANGNLAQVNRFLDAGQYDGSRHLFWTEDNRLTNAVDERFYSYYAYDHGGERTLKITGENNLMDVNADMMLCQSDLREVTLYTSPYLVAGNHGYTKHYYAGTERVAARIGGGGLDRNGDFLREDPNPDEGMSGLAISLLESCNTGMQSRLLDRNENLEISSPCGDPAVSEELAVELDLGQIPVVLTADITVDPSEFDNAMIENAPSNNDHEDGYFYHSDHLGSASWITDNGGEPVQHLQYLPYGEPFVNQRTTGYNERFTFTGKERDSETGYSYFGARYLDHELMTAWLSVDPMSDKYPSISPYAYCAWNPLKLVDPDGRSGEPSIDKRNKIITITSKLYFYGPKASPELSRAIATGIASQWNGANATYELNGITYTVRFRIQYETISFEKALALAKNNTDKKNNFIWIGDAQMGSSHTMQYKEKYGYGGNSFWLTVHDDLANSTTPAHEFGHGLGLNHPEEDMSRCTERPDIMIPRDSPYGPMWSLKSANGSYIVNPNSRRVMEKNVQEALDCNCGSVRNFIFDYNGELVNID